MRRSTAVRCIGRKLARVIGARWPQRNGRGSRLGIPLGNCRCAGAAKSAQTPGWVPDSRSGVGEQEVLSPIGSGAQGPQIGEKEPVPTPSTAQELEALELARC